MTAPEGSPHITVVVATFNRAPLLPRLVAALEAQTAEFPFEVVIVDDRSTDDTWATLQRLAAAASVPIHPLRLPSNAGPATARNTGWRAARAPLVAFTDDDCVPQPGWLAGLTRALRESDIVQGRTEPDPAQEANRGPFSHTMHVKGENGYYATCNIAYRRAVLERVGGFDETFRRPYGEDIDLAWRAKEIGATSTFARDALVLHDIRPGRLRDHARDLRRRSGIVQLVKTHPAMRAKFELRPFLRRSHALALLAVVGGAVAVTGRGPVARGAGVALLAPYVRHRRRVAPPEQLAPRYRQLPLALASDLAEVGVLAVASARARTLVL